MIFDTWYWCQDYTFLVVHFKKMGKGFSPSRLSINHWIGGWLPGVSLPRQNVHKQDNKPQIAPKGHTSTLHSLHCHWWVWIDQLAFSHNLPKEPKDWISFDFKKQTSLPIWPSILEHFRFCHRSPQKKWESLSSPSFMCNSVSRYMHKDQASTPLFTLFKPCNDRMPRGTTWFHTGFNLSHNYTLFHGQIW